MNPAPIALPDRPLVVRPPGLRFVGVAVIGVLLAVVALCTVAPIGDLITDVGLAGKAVPVPGATVDGSCSIGAAFTTCDVTLTAPRRGASLQQRKVNYLFVEVGVVKHTFRVLADPARPALLTTDLAQDRLWNRIGTLVVSAALSAFVIIAALLGLGGALRTQRATVRALSRRVLRCVLLRMDDYARGQWAVTAGSARRVWQVPNRARPIVMDPGRRLILGITAGDGAFAMPLDRDLRWIGLDAAQRRALREALGPERLGGWLGVLDTPARATERGRWRRFARGLARAGLGFVAATAGTAWWAFAEDGRGAGPHIADLAFAVSGAIAVGLLLGAARIRAKAARHEAILR
jgi:hypothetical protein